MRRLLVAILVLAALFGAGAWYDRPPATPGAWLATAGLRPQQAEIAGRRLRYVRAGAGPALVLVHGFGSSLYTWKDVIPALAARHQVIALDLPGFGESERPADLAVEDLPRAVIGLLDRLGVAEAVLVGNSMGGGTAVLVAANAPGRVSALVLVDAAVYNMATADRPGSVRVATSPLAGMLDFLPGKRLLVERSLRQVFHDDALVTRERVAEYLAAAQRPGSVAALRSLGRSLDERPARIAEALAGLAAPTLVVWGAEDAWIPLTHADRLTAAIAGARKVVIPECGHMPQEEKPAELARLLLEFLG
jgi:pimeloyl-ACP methyl ester carboxylesterase